jgi:1-acyl-sn-glycerol-3-phosphate acyltransferase
MMLFIRSLIFNIWVYLSMGVMAIGMLPIGMASREGAYWVMRLYSRQIFWVARHLLGLKWEVRGTVPTGSALIVSKHQSFADMMMFQVAMPQAKFVMKQELRWAPFLGWYAMRVGTVSVHRGKGGAAVAAMTRQLLAEQEAKPGQIVIFAQGTRTPPGVEAQYKIGAWRLSQTFAHLPCIPVALNTGLFWGKKDFLRRPGTMVLEFLDPVDPTGMEAQPFLAEVGGRIEAACDALYAEAAAKGEGIEWQSRPA